MRPLATLVCLALSGAAAAAMPIPPPDGARQVAQRISPADSYALPLAGWQDGTVPARPLEGRVARETWRLDSGSLTTLQVLAPLRESLAEAGFEVLFECRDRECGGFDFRFAIEVVPAPDMHVDIRNYRFLSAMRGDDEALSLLVSRSNSAAYVQMIHVTPIGPADPAAPVPVASAPLAERLLAEGHAVLRGLDFGSGAAALTGGAEAALAALAAFLGANPDLIIAFVGHTDSVGELEANIALSRRRAEAVRAALLDRHGVAPDRVRAEGMGYLAPIASNLTPEGREANRRVEVIVLPAPRAQDP